MPFCSRFTGPSSPRQGCSGKRRRQALGLPPSPELWHRIEPRPWPKFWRQVNHSRSGELRRGCGEITCRKFNFGKNARGSDYGLHLPAALLMIRSTPSSCHDGCDALHHHPCCLSPFGFFWRRVYAQTLGAEQQAAWRARLLSPLCGILSAWSRSSVPGRWSISCCRSSLKPVTGAARHGLSGFTFTDDGSDDALCSVCCL